MTHKEVIAALRSTPSRSKRELFDTAADMIEAAMDKPVVSNADRIRSMTDEELAEFLDDCNSQGCVCPTRDCSATCQQCIVEWLKQPEDHFREVTKMID